MRAASQSPAVENLGYTTLLSVRLFTPWTFARNSVRRPPALCPVRV